MVTDLFLSASTAETLATNTLDPEEPYRSKD